MKNIDNKTLNERLTDSYISGLIHGDGEFIVNLGVRKRKEYIKINLCPTFTLIKHNRNMNIIKKIINRFNNIGTYRIDNKKIIRYRVRDIESINKILIPFFDENQVKENKLLEYIKYRYIVEKLLKISNKWYCKDLENEDNSLMLDLITISVNMNKNKKSSIEFELKDLCFEDREKVLNNQLSKKISLELENYISNFNYKKEINIDFINGLFDSKGWIILGLNLNKSKNIVIRLEYGIVSDILNSKLLYDIKEIFNVGVVTKINSNEKLINYKVSKLDFLSKVLPKIYNISNYMEILENNNINKGPIINDIKIKRIIKILKLYEEYKINKDKRILEEILLNSYEIRDINLKNKELLNEYLIRMKNKLCIK